MYVWRVAGPSSGSSWQIMLHIYAWKHYYTVNVVQVLGSQWRTLSEGILFLELGLAVTEHQKV